MFAKHYMTGLWEVKLGLTCHCCLRQSHRCHLSRWLPPTPVTLAFLLHILFISNRCWQRHGGGDLDENEGSMDDVGGMDNGVLKEGKIF